MRWARRDGRVVQTRDLDVSTLLALTGAAGPSVVQLRGPDVMPEALGPVVLKLLVDQEDVLARGALLTLNERGTRVRVLPLSR